MGLQLKSKRKRVSDSQIVTMSDAARMIPYSRKTLYKHLKQGKLSKTRFKDGSSGIQISELIRVYGSDITPLEEVIKEKEVVTPFTGGDSDPKLDLLLKKIENLESEVNRLNNTVENLNNRLEHKPLPSEPQPLSKPAQVEPVKSKGWQSSYIDRMKESLAKNNKK